MLGALRAGRGERARRPCARAGQRSGSAARSSRPRCPTCRMFPADSYDLIALLDVLEHVPDDKGSLAAIFTRLKPGGALLLTVPANPWMWSAHDVAHHHHRRYRKARDRRAGARRGLRDRPAVAVQQPAVPADRRGAPARQAARRRQRRRRDAVAAGQPALDTSVRRRSRAYRPIAVAVRRVFSRGASSASAAARRPA